MIHLSKHQEFTQFIHQHHPVTLVCWDMERRIIIVCVSGRGYSAQLPEDTPGAPAAEVLCHPRPTQPQEQDHKSSLRLQTYH